MLGHMSVTDAGRLAAAPLMTAIDGRVQLPGLPASDEAMAERLLALVDDALQALATSNELPGRVVVVRQPDVSTIARPVSPARMAQIVQAEVERVVSQAVRADAPAAASAPMVYFRDEADVVRTLAQRMATNRPTTDWFWPSVVEGWTPSAPPERAITLLMERALATPVPVATLAHVVDTLASTGALDTVLERFTESDGRTWLKAIRWPEAEAVAVAVPERADGRPSTLAMTTRSEDLVRRWVERWGGGVRDSRAVWLGAMLVVADRPERGTDPRLPQAVRVWLESVVTQGRSTGGEDGTDGATIRTGQRESLMADARAWLQSNPRSPLDSLFGGGPPFPLPPRDATSSPSSAGRPPVDDDANRSDHASVEAPTWRAPRHTDNAGFALLVPLLTHVGLPRILASDPTLIDRDWPTALLLRLSRRLGVAFDDPVIAWIPARPASIAHTDRVLTAEVIRAARIRLRMNAGITMRQLVRRPGAVVAGSEQVDVLLQSAAIDSGLVRARLDAEPAWVPWLERALHFHYLDAVDLSA
jgi:hypothetical protein